MATRMTKLHHDPWTSRPCSFEVMKAVPPENFLINFNVTNSDPE